MNTTKEQDKAIKDIKAQLARDYPQAEVKAFRVTLIPETEIQGGMALVRAELGFPKDEGSFRDQLRGACVFIVSARGRVEVWSVRQAFKAPARRKDLHHRQAAHVGRN